MSKKAKHPDQVAIDLATIGTLLAVTASTYQALDIMEKAAGEVGEAIGNIGPEVQKQRESWEKRRDHLLSHAPLALIPGVGLPLLGAAVRKDFNRWGWW